MDSEDEVEEDSSRSWASWSSSGCKNRYSISKRTRKQHPKSSCWKEVSGEGSSMVKELENEKVDGRVLARPWTVVLSRFQRGDCGSVLGLPFRLCRNHTAPPTPASASSPTETIHNKNNCVD